MSPFFLSWRGCLLFCTTVFLGTTQIASGQDGSLQCQDKWIDGVKVTLKCEIRKASIASKCATQQNITVFNTGTFEKCRVKGAGYANCYLTPQSPSTQPASCWCEQNDTFFIFKYRFNADFFRDNGSWTCQNACLDSTGLVNPLIMSTASNCNASVEKSDCEKKDCKGASVCKLDETVNEGECKCPFGYEGEACEICGTFETERGCDNRLAVSVIFLIAIICLLLIVLLIYLFCFPKTRDVRVNRKCKTDEELTTFITSLRRRCQSIMNELGGYPTIFIGVLQGPCGEESYVKISGRNICTLQKAKSEVEKAIGVKGSSNASTGGTYHGSGARQP